MMKARPLEKPVVDPVCGMSVDPETVKIIATIEGQNYYFCAEGCAKPLKRIPKSILNRNATSQKAGGVVIWRDLKKRPMENR